MHKSPITRFRPSLEGLEAKQLLSATAAASYVLTDANAPAAAARRTGANLPKDGFLGFRITQPNRFNNHLTPPFPQVMVQARPPIPGQVYNILFISLRNGSAQTFSAGNNFQVRLPGGKAFPILTGNQTWAPGQIFVFYVLTKKYYPLAQIPGGFQFDLNGRSSTLVPGPSGIFLRIKYNPAKFANQLNHIVAFGQGNQGGKGVFFGLPNTSINDFVSAKARKIDFGGHF
jgi:hypothetical protein